MENLRNQLEDWKNLILNNQSIPPDLTPYNLPGVTKQNIVDHLETIINLSKKVNLGNSEIDALVNTFISPILFTLNTYKAPFPSNPMGYLPSIIDYLKQLYFIFGFYIPLTSTKNTSQQMLSKIISEEGLKLTQLEDITKLKENAIDLSNKVKTDYQNIQQTQTNVISTYNEINSKNTEIQKIHNEILQSHNETLKNVDLIKDNKQQLVTINEELNKENKELKDLIKKNKEQQKEIDRILGRANQAGLAGSFRKRKTELLWMMLIWSVLLIGSISGLVYYLNVHIIKLILDNTDITKVILSTVLLRSLILVPFGIAIFITSKQYNLAFRLHEEYAFKEAAAMAFEGYKKETENSGTNDGTLLDDLVNTLMNNLSRNPSDIFEKKQSKIIYPVKKED